MAYLEVEPNSAPVYTSPLSCSPPTKENVVVQATLATLSVVPAEILGLIADHADCWERNSLCRINRFFNRACTISLYGGRINITKVQALRSLADTLLQLQPEFALMVKDLCISASIEGFAWSARRSPCE